MPTVLPLETKRMVATDVSGHAAVTLMSGRFPVRTIARSHDGRLVTFDWWPWIRAAVSIASRGSYHPERIVTTARSLTVVTQDGTVWHACLRRVNGELHLDLVHYQADGGQS